MPKKPQKTSRSKQSFTARGRDGSQWVFCLKIPPGNRITDEVFARQLREAIETSGVSQYHLAQAAGIPQASISYFMSGKDLKLSTFTRLARVMGMKLELNATAGPKKIS